MVTFPERAYHDFCSVCVLFQQVVLFLHVSSLAVPQFLAVDADLNILVVDGPRRCARKTKDVTAHSAMMSSV